MKLTTVEELKTLSPRQQKEAVKGNRRAAGTALAGLVLAGSVATGVGINIENRGFASAVEAVSTAKDPKALNGILFLLPGTYVRGTLQTPESIETAQSSSNVVTVVKPGQAIAVQNPGIITKTDGEGNTTLWYGFELENEANSSGKAPWVVVDGTDLSTQPNAYKVLMANGDRNFSLASPDPSDLLPVTYDDNSQSLLLEAHDTEHFRSMGYTPNGKIAKWNTTQEVPVQVAVGFTTTLENAEQMLQNNQ